MTQTRSRGLTESFAEEAITQTTDVVSGSESIPSRSRMNKTKQQLRSSDLKESQVDPPEVDEDGRSVTKRSPESAIWRSRLWPRNTGVVA